MSHTSSRLRQVMDWRAAVLAGLVAGLVFLLFQLIATSIVLGESPWIVLNQIAAIVLGPAGLVDSFALNPAAFILGLLIHFLFSILFTLLLAFIIHRWGLAVGIIGGALFGLALYGLNYYAFARLFTLTWFSGMRSAYVILAHIVFGAVAGGVYEALEKDIYVAE